MRTCPSCGSEVEAIKTGQTRRAHEDGGKYTIQKLSNSVNYNDPMWNVEYESGEKFLRCESWIKKDKIVAR